MRRASFAVRLSRAFFGLITLWCLGCSSYEPLLGSLIGMRSIGGMACDSPMPGERSAVAVPNGNDVAHAVSTVSAANGERDFDCGCGSSCHAPSPTFAVVKPRSLPVPVAAHLRDSAPESISRAPLLPPPREHELANGLSLEKTAAHFTLSPHTIDTHVRSSYAKLQARTHAAAVAKAMRDRIL